MLSLNSSILSCCYIACMVFPYLYITALFKKVNLSALSSCGQLTSKTSQLWTAKASPHFAVPQPQSDGSSKLKFLTESSWANDLSPNVPSNVWGVEEGEQQHLWMTSVIPCEDSTGGERKRGNGNFFLKSETSSWLWRIICPCQNLKPNVSFKGLALSQSQNKGRLSCIPLYDKLKLNAEIIHHS